MSAIIFLISSFFGSNPRALMATCGTSTRHVCCCCCCCHTVYTLFIQLYTRLRTVTNLQFLHVYCSSAIRVKQIKSLLDFLLLLLGQFDFGTRLLPLARRGSRFSVARSLKRRVKRVRQRNTGDVFRSTVTMMLANLSLHAAPPDQTDTRFHAENKTSRQIPLVNSVYISYHTFT